MHLLGVPDVNNLGDDVCPCGICRAQIIRGSPVETAGPSILSIYELPSSVGIVRGLQSPPTGAPLTTFAFDCSVPRALLQVLEGT